MFKEEISLSKHVHPHLKEEIMDYHMIHIYRPILRGGSFSPLLQVYPNMSKSNIRGKTLFLSHTCSLKVKYTVMMNILHKYIYNPSDNTDLMS